jgi:hypothetical protein
MPERVPFPVMKIVPSSPAGYARHLGGQRVGDHPRQRVGPPLPGSLRPAPLALRPLGELPLDPHAATQEVDGLDAEREQLADPKPEPGLSEDHGPVAAPAWPGPAPRPADGQRHDPLRLISRKLDADDG